MGFVSDGPKATTEKLFVAAETDSELATLDTATFPTRWTKVGEVVAKQARSPELTGTSEGRLYGYFPGEVGRGFVQELDRTGNAIGERVTDQVVLRNDAEPAAAAGSGWVLTK